MTQFRRLDVIFGWLTFVVAMLVYGSTMEPTASFWDCGEFIAAAYKLQVGHPPGAPLFAMLGRVFALFASDVTMVAFMVNMLSVTASALTIAFLFWTITAFVKRTYRIEDKSEDIKWDGLRIFKAISAGLLGALAYTFTDTFWFSAVEGEVYATSSLFTAVVFWAALRWEQVADERHADRWIVLIAYLIGLSVGVHLLNLLTIPAIGLIYYYRKYQNITSKGVVYTLGVSMAILLFIQYGIIPGTVSLGAGFEKFFVNSIGTGFGSGLFAYMIFLALVIIGGIVYSMKKQKAVMNLAFWCVGVIVIGYSSYAMIIIRSSANPPMDENNPENVYSLISYLNRDQYGSRPLVYGQYYDAEITQSNDKGDPMYSKSYSVKSNGRTLGTFTIESDAKAFVESNKDKGKLDIVHEYIVTDYKPEYDFEDGRKTILPRMWSNEGHHTAYYEYWGDVKKGGKPNFGNNLGYMFRYQMGWMYWRYFLWNFVGRENDMQGDGSLTHGHWISGISFIDEVFSGSPQKNMPDELKDNKARNTYYFLPLILGIIGLFFHFKKDKKGGIIVLLLFFLTGLAIVLYLNQPPIEPRERDYTYAGSFYAFCIWVGLGYLGLVNWLKKYAPENVVAYGVLPLTLLAGPGILANQNWDDHTRAKRYAARDFAFNYLNSCAKDAILFTNGDNDTFPLWYLQEVEGVRTDVRVVNMSLLNTDWYITQMKRAAYDGKPVPFGLSEPEYRQGLRDQVLLDGQSTRYLSVIDQMRFLRQKDGNTVPVNQRGDQLYFFQSNKMFLPVDSAKVVNNGTVPKGMEGRVQKSISWEMKKSYLLKNEVMILDLLSQFKWDRPVYFAITVGDRFIGLEKFFQLEGLAYRLMPYEVRSHDGQLGEINSNIMYENYMNTFKWGNIQQEGVYLDETIMRMTMNFRNNFVRLASKLMVEGKIDKAVKVLDRAEEIMPDRQVPYNYFSLLMADLYVSLKEFDKANAILARLEERMTQEVTYYAQFKKPGKTIQENDGRAKYILQEIQKLREIIAKGGRKTTIPDGMQVPAELSVDTSTPAPADSSKP